MQRALCTFTGKGQPQASLSQPGQEFAPNSPSYGRYLNKRFLTKRVNLNTLKSSSGPKGAQSSRTPRGAGFLSLSRTGQRFWQFKPNGTGVAKKSPRAEGGRGEVNSPLQLINSNTQTTRVGGFLAPFGSLLVPLGPHLLTLACVFLTFASLPGAIFNIVWYFRWESYVKWGGNAH